jgi:ribosomal protein S18 acetylase RimI-like enzyme
MYDPRMSEPHIRNVRPDELEQVWRVHVASSSDLAMRRGRPARPADEPVSTDARAVLASDPDGYFCAIEDGRIRGMVSALVRGRVWYLSMFFVLPGDQGRGLGRALLERALAYGEARGVEARCVWACSRAQVRYVMARMAPRPWSAPASGSAN